MLTNTKIRKAAALPCPTKTMVEVRITKRAASSEIDKLSSQIRKLPKPDLPIGQRPKDKQSSEKVTPRDINSFTVTNAVS